MLLLVTDLGACGLRWWRMSRTDLLLYIAIAARRLPDMQDGAVDITLRSSSRRSDQKTRGLCLRQERGEEEDRWVHSSKQEEWMAFGQPGLCSYIIEGIYHTDSEAMCPRIVIFTR